MIIFVFFQFFSILAVSMSMAAILKKSTLKSLIKASPRNVSDKLLTEERKKKNNNNKN